MSSSEKAILIIQGGQYGSEAKGMVAAALCERRHVDYAVRTGAVNAGHSVYYKGKKYVNQQLPTGWVNEGTELVLGPGAYINPEILEREINIILEATGKWPAVWIDHRCGLHLPEHTERAGSSGRHYRIGATGKGCSEAIIDRIKLRGNGGKLFRDWVNDNPAWILTPTFIDTADLLNTAYDAGSQILLEGTQGTLLDLYLGPYPYTTHKQCTAAQWVVEAGLSPGLEYEIVLVARTYPIRVAGNSGPMPNEIDWVTLACEINDKLSKAKKPPLVEKRALAYFENEWHKLGQYSYASPQVEASERNRDAWRNCPPDVQAELSKLFEFTTVTKKLRRVARLDIEQLKYSVMVNRPSYVVLTFLNYEFPEFWGLSCGDCLPDHALDRVDSYLRDLESKIGADIGMVTWGPEFSNLMRPRVIPGVRF